MRFSHRLCFLAALALASAAFCSAASAYTYSGAPVQKKTPETSASQQVSRSVGDPYLARLFEKLPGYEREIKKVYDDYSGWVIKFADEYGAPPIIAMANSKEEQYLALFQNPAEFMDLYKALSETIPDERQRAKISLALTNSMFMGSPEEGFQQAYADALRADKQASLAGNVQSRRHVEALLRSQNKRENLLSVIKRDSRLYAELLNSLGEEDLQVLQEIIHYPNAAAFLQNVGREGLGMAKKTPSIIMLSTVLAPEELHKLPEVFKRYPKLDEALQTCGIEAYFTIMQAPDLYFKMVEHQMGKRAERYYSSWGVLASQFISNPDGDKLLRQVKDFTPEQTSAVAYGLAQLLDSGSGILSEDGSEVNAVVGAYCDFYIIPLFARYGDLAYRVVNKYESRLLVGELIMKNWEGDRRDVSPVLTAIDRYGDYGLAAAAELAFNRDLHPAILGRSGDQSSKALMIFYYDQVLDGFKVTGRGKSFYDALNFAFNEYDFDPATCLPTDKNSGLSLLAFIPGYDFVVPVLNYVKYHQTPTFGEYVFAVWDAVQVATLGVAGLNALVPSVDDVSKSGSKAAISHADDLAKAGGKAAASYIDDVGEMGGKIARAGRKAGVGVKSLVAGGVKKTMGTLDDISKAAWKANTSLLSNLSSSSFAKRLIKEMAIEPVLYHQGANAFIAGLKNRMARRVATQF